MSTVSPPGSCVWEFDGTNWVVTETGCASGYVCARVAGAGGVAFTTKGQKVTDAEFRKGLNEAHLKKFQVASDVIPTALTLAAGSIYKMDCVK